MLPLLGIEVRFLGRSPHTLVTISITVSRLADGQSIIKSHYHFTSLVTQGQLKSQTKYLTGQHTSEGADCPGCTAAPRVSAPFTFLLSYFFQT